MELNCYKFVYKYKYMTSAQSTTNAQEKSDASSTPFVSEVLDHIQMAFAVMLWNARNT